MAEQAMQMDEILEKLARVQALQDRATTPHEAEAAAGAMTRLLTKYNLDALDVQRRLGSKAPPITVDKLTVSGVGTSWERSLFAGLARHNQCRAVYYIGTKDIVLFGPAAALPLVREMYRALQRTVLHLTDLAWSAVREITTTPPKWKNAYRLGCVTGINTALERATAAAVAQVEQGSALVLVNEEAIAKEVEHHFGKLSKSHKVSFDARAYAHGYYDGLEVNVSSRGDLGRGN